MRILRSIALAAAVAAMAGCASKDPDFALPMPQPVLPHLREPRTHALALEGREVQLLAIRDEASGECWGPDGTPLPPGAVVVPDMLPMESEVIVLEPGRRMFTLHLVEAGLDSDDSLAERSFFAPGSASIPHTGSLSAPARFGAESQVALSVSVPEDASVLEGLEYRMLPGDLTVVATAEAPDWETALLPATGIRAESLEIGLPGSAGGGMLFLVTGAVVLPNEELLEPRTHQLYLRGHYPDGSEAMVRSSNSRNAIWPQQYLREHPGAAVYILPRATGDAPIRVEYVHGRARRVVFPPIALRPRAGAP